MSFASIIPVLLGIVLLPLAAPLCPGDKQDFYTEAPPSEEGNEQQKQQQEQEKPESYEGYPSTEEIWAERSGFCYRFFHEKQPWFPSESMCRTWGGHLASVASDEENRLVGRLSDCQDAWIGAFATDYHRTRDPASYEWTDGGKVAAAAAAPGTGGYSRHNFTASFDPHMGAVRATGLSWRNSHYHERLPYVCKVAAKKADARAASHCPLPFKYFRSNCYWLSNFEASFVSASLHCQRELSSRLASIRTPAEVQFLSILELERDTCQLDTVWLGLVKQDPCRSGGQPSSQMSAEAREEAKEPPSPNSSCYQWTDFSGEHDGGYPRWEDGHPNLQDRTVNCASLSGQVLRSEKCYTRHRFVCKRPAVNGGTEEDQQQQAWPAVPPTLQQHQVAEETETQPSAASAFAESVKEKEKISRNIETQEQEMAIAPPNPQQQQSADLTEAEPNTVAPDASAESVRRNEEVGNQGVDVEERETAR